MIETDRQRQWIVFLLVLLAIGLVGTGAFIAQRIHMARAARMRAVAVPVHRDAPIATWEGQSFYRGDRVQIVQWSGTFKPDETGFPEEVEAGVGRVGTLIAGERRKSNQYVTIDPNEPVQIVRVRWDPQTWPVMHSERSVALGAFEATIHVSYLDNGRRD